MARIKDRNQVPALPVYWRDPENGHKVYWDAAREHFLTFMARINAYTDGNGKSRVAESEVENQVCAQFPGWACDGEVPRNVVETMRPSGGCTSCGRR